LADLKLDERGCVPTLAIPITVKTLTDGGFFFTRSIGYTYKCLASGIWALRQGLAANMGPSAGAGDSGPKPSLIFEKVITEITMAAGDSDTNGAVAGSLLGTLFGYSNLPVDWVHDLEHKNWLLSKADAAIYLSLCEGPPYDSTKDPDNLVDGGKGDMTPKEVETQWRSYYHMQRKRMADYRGR